MTAMTKYFLRRFVYLIVVFFLISVVIFLIYSLAPGDPVLHFMDANFAEGSDPVLWQQTYEQVRASLGLDRPLYVQYIAWMSNLLRLDFGYSMMYRRPVSMVVVDPLRNTVTLNIINLILVFIISIPLAIKSAVKRGSIFDSAVQVSTVTFDSLPTFITALIVILIFGVWLGWFPLTGMSTPGFVGTPWEVAMDRARFMVLPLMTMVIGSMAGITRYIRAAMIEILSQDYIRTARAKGAKERYVVYRHAFRNAQIIVIQTLSGWFLGIFGGSVMIERVFLWNGMGDLMVRSVFNQDNMVVFTIIMLFTSISLFGFFIIDILFAICDPKIKLNE